MKYLISAILIILLISCDDENPVDTVQDEIPQLIQLSQDTVYRNIPFQIGIGPFEKSNRFVDFYDSGNKRIQSEYHGYDTINRIAHYSLTPDFNNKDGKISCVIKDTLELISDFEIIIDDSFIDLAITGFSKDYVKEEEDFDIIFNKNIEGLNIEKVYPENIGYREFNIIKRDNNKLTVNHDYFINSKILININDSTYISNDSAFLCSNSKDLGIDLDDGCTIQDLKITENSIRFYIREYSYGNNWKEDKSHYFAFDKNEIVISNNESGVLEYNGSSDNWSYRVSSYYGSNSPNYRDVEGLEALNFEVKIHYIKAE